MSKLFFPDEFYKQLALISSKASSLKDVHDSLKFFDVDLYKYKLNEEYKTAQDDLKYSPNVTSHPIIIDFLSKNARKDLNCAKLIDTTDSMSSLKKFSLQKVIMENNADRLKIISSLYNIKEEIKCKKDLLLKLKNENNNCEINSSIGLNAKLACYRKELHLIKDEMSDVQNKANKMMKLAQFLIKQRRLFLDCEEDIANLAKSVEEDLTAINKKRIMCRQKLIDVKKEICTANSVIPSLKHLYETSLDSLKSINSTIQNKMKSDDLCFHHLGSINGNVKIYNLLMSLLDEYREKCKLTDMFERIESSNADYKDEFGTISKYCDKISSYMVPLNAKAGKKLDSISAVKAKNEQVIMQIENVYNEWPILRKFSKV